MKRGWRLEIESTKDTATVLRAIADDMDGKDVSFDAAYTFSPNVELSDQLSGVRPGSVTPNQPDATDLLASAHEVVCHWTDGGCSEAMGGLINAVQDYESAQDEPAAVTPIVTPNLVDAARRMLDDYQTGRPEHKSALWLESVLEDYEDATTAPGPIIVEVSGGNVQDVRDIPSGVTVEVRDYDNGEEATEEERADMGQDADGKFYSVGEWS